MLRRKPHRIYYEDLAIEELAARTEAELNGDKLSGYDEVEDDK